MWCTTCGAYLSKNHRCLPAWLVWCPEDDESEEDARRAFGADAEMAAIDYAEKECSDDPELNSVYLNGGKTLYVKPEAGRELAVVEVYGEAVIDFHSREKRVKDHE